MCRDYEKATTDRIILAGLLITVALSLVTFAQAYPETYRVDSGCCSSHVLAKDFSAYYVGAWRLFHDAANVYTPGVVADGGPNISPHPETFKYLPSFLLYVSPLLLLSYPTALVSFDVFQLLLLPLMAFFIFRLVRERGVVVTLIVGAIVLLQPSPSWQWGLSASYYWQWGEGQAKVLQTFLLLLSFYLGSRKKPFLSGAALGLAAFDLRFALISLPLFLVYNKPQFRLAAAGALCFGLASNLPFIIPGVASGFESMMLSSGVTTPLYYYSYIPLLTIVCLTILKASDVAGLVRKARAWPD